MTDDPLWQVDKDKSVKDEWLELKDPEGWYSAIVRFDGCIHLHRCYNKPYSFDSKDSDYIHIFYIDDMIERLKAIKAEALKHYGKDWPV